MQILPEDVNAADIKLDGLGLREKEGLLDEIHRAQRRVVHVRSGIPIDVARREKAPDGQSDPCSEARYVHGVLGTKDG